MSNPLNTPPVHYATVRYRGEICIVLDMPFAVHAPVRRWLLSIFPAIFVVRPKGNAGIQPHHPVARLFASPPMFEVIYRDGTRLIGDRAEYALLQCDTIQGWHPLNIPPRVYSIGGM